MTEVKVNNETDGQEEVTSNPIVIVDSVSTENIMAQKQQSNNAISRGQI